MQRVSWIHMNGFPLACKYILSLLCLGAHDAACGIACNEGMHLLLQSTDIIWTILLAEYVNGEDLGVIEILAALCSGTGSFLIGLHAADTLDEPWVPILVTRRSHSNFVSFPLFICACSAFVFAFHVLGLGFGTVPRSLEHLKQSWSCLVLSGLTPWCSASVRLWKVNLLPPFILALCVSTLRMGTQELLRPDNRLAGSMSIVEFTAIKLALSALTAFALAMLCESTGVNGQSWWRALAEESDAGILLVLLGGVFILIFQAGTL